jgi:heavy metal response regulator
MHILLVEDEKKIATFIKRGLKEAGYIVDIASDGEEGHYIATTNEFDLIILDIMLPKMDGLALCKKLREDKISAPILMLTAKDDTTDKVKGLDSGADDYLTKPFVFEELLARIRAHLRKKDNQEATRYQVADLSLDVLSHKVERAGKEIELTTKQYTLLAYLMRNAGTIVTRTMISEHVWDIHYDVSTNVIDVYINYLRSKVDKGHKQKLIKTVRGRGYILSE